MTNKAEKNEVRLKKKRDNYGATWLQETLGNTYR